MKTRREFLTTAAMTSAVLGGTATAQDEPAPDASDRPAFRPDTAIGLGGVAIGNGHAATPDAQALATLDAAWDAGIRHFDTAPFYGFGLSERRFGLGLDQRPRDEYLLSTKVGRLLIPSDNPESGFWKDLPGADIKVDYGASAARRSVEESLQRLGVSRLDIAYIHDLSPDFFGDDWNDHFETARKGAMAELTKMREEGLIKAWGLGVNTIEPILRTLEVADPDIFLSATQYSLVYHQDALEKLFPVCAERNVPLVIGAPLNFGFLAGRNRYNYGPTIPPGMLEKRAAMLEIADEHGVDLRTAALQFSAAPEVVATVIPGARTPQQARQSAESMKAKIPAEFWDALKAKELIAANAPVPA